MTARGNRWPAALRSIAWHILMVAIAVLMGLPFVWMASTALKPAADATSYPPSLLPIPFSTENIVWVLTQFPFVRYFGNTMLVATFAVGGELVFCSLAAYAFARMRFPGRDVLFLLFLGTLMIPFYITMIPAFIVVKWLGLVNTLAAVVVPRLASAFGTFLLRQFFLTIPAEIEDAARIDGASRIVFLVRILLPLSVPALATFGVFLFLGTWNSFLWPLLVLNDPNLSVLQLGLARFRGEYVVKVSLLMAATLLSVLPVMVVFLIGQKHLVRGVVLSGIKG